MKITKEKKGITLVALIITIIVLLILAVVAINAVQNDGIIEYAKNARTEYEKAQDEEQAQLDYYLSQIESSDGKKIVHNGIIPKYGKYYVGVPAETSDIQSITPTYKEGEKFPEKPQTGDIYLYGDYEYRYNLYAQFSNDAVFLQWSSIPEGNTAYNGWGVKLNVARDEESYGEILTTINNYDITSTTALFYGCESLKVVPKLPSGVITMGSTFFGCKALEKAPEIPSKVISLTSTFAYCDALKDAPKIPEGATNMNYTFYECKALEKAPEIPGSVTKMTQTFLNCKSLTGDVIIKTKEIKTYDECFKIKNSEGEVTNQITLVGINFDETTKTYENQDVLEKLKASAAGSTKVNVTIKGVD